MRVDEAAGNRPGRYCSSVAICHRTHETMAYMCVHDVVSNFYTCVHDVASKSARPYCPTHSSPGACEISSIDVTLDGATVPVQSFSFDGADATFHIDLEAVGLSWPTICLSHHAVIHHLTPAPPRSRSSFNVFEIYHLTR